MVANNSSNHSLPTIHDYIINSCYIGEGFLMILANLLTIVALVSHQNLRRKETLLLVGLASADLTSGIGFFFGGIHRLDLAISRRSKELVSAWSCMTHFETVFFIVGAESQGLMQFLISLDRMIALTFMTYYHTLDRGYTLMLLGGVALHGVVTGAISFVTSYVFMRDFYVGAVCLGTWAIPTWMAVYYTSLSSIGGFGSVGLYGFVIIVMLMRKKTTTSSSQTDRLQRKFTITIGVVTLFTLIFHTIPYGALTVLDQFYTREEMATLSRYLWILVNVNSLVNVFVYIFRMREVRAAMKNVLTCKIGQVEPLGASLHSDKRRASQASKRASVISVASANVSRANSPMPK